MKRMITIMAGILFENILIINVTNANECQRIERQLNEENHKLRQGGNASHMKMWQQTLAGFFIARHTPLPPICMRNTIHPTATATQFKELLQAN